MGRRVPVRNLHIPRNHRMSALLLRFPVDRESGILERKLERSSVEFGGVPNGMEPQVFER